MPPPLFEQILRKLPCDEGNCHESKILGSCVTLCHPETWKEPTKCFHIVRISPIPPKQAISIIVRMPTFCGRPCDLARPPSEIFFGHLLSLEPCTSDCFCLHTKSSS